MSRFTYVIAEGVLDVVFLSQVLRHGYGFSVIDRRSQLPADASGWLDNFKWPVGEDIARRAVPAPAILAKDGAIVGLQNGRGLTEMARKAREDEERFFRLRWRPSAWAVVLDNDDAPPSNRFDDFASLAENLGYPRPVALGKVHQVAETRAGVFAFPGPSRAGTIEDVLLPLAASRFPALSRHAESFVSGWQGCDDAQDGDDFVELRKPSGPKKATLSATAALLKPGKPLNASIEDQNWIPNDPKSCPALQPLMEFLDQLLAPSG